jgi:hypothetical protein
LLDCSNGRGLAKPTLTLLSFAGQQVALKALVPFDFPAAGYSESFHRCSIALDFGHLYLLFVFMANTIELFRGEKHGHIPSF